jgi:hypothetical protein
MQQATASSYHLPLFSHSKLKKMKRLLLTIYNHNSIYTRRGLVILREIAIQEVHPCLADQPLNGARIAEPDNSGLFGPRLALT